MKAEEARLPGLLPGERQEALSIGALYGRVSAVIGRAFPGPSPVWVTGEIQSITDRTGHCYMDLVDPDGARDRQTPVLKVNCWSRTWTAIKTTLERQHLTLEPGLVITIQGRPEVYAPRGQLNFIVSNLDVTALLGRVAARRSALLRTLESEGLIGVNKSLPVPDLPLSVGLVSSRDTEGYRDFVGQLEASGFSFRVQVVPVMVQGSHAPRQIAGAIGALCAAGCEVLAIVRGGGSKADLSAFDAGPVARAIASATIPVWTGIGHTGDQSVADVVSHRSFVTPTECGAALVSHVAERWIEAVDSARLLARRADQALTEALRRDEDARARLCNAARGQLERQQDRVHSGAGRITGAAQRTVDGSRSYLAQRCSRLSRLSSSQLDRADDRVSTWRRLISAYDLERQLERGYTITTDDDGRLLRSALEATAGMAIITRFADGKARSEVTASERSDGDRNEDAGRSREEAK